MSAKLTAQVPTGYQSKELIKKAGLNLGDVDQFPDINVTLDGADDVDGDLNAIKGARCNQARLTIRRRSVSSAREGARRGGPRVDHRRRLAQEECDPRSVARQRGLTNCAGDSWAGGVPIECPSFAYSKVLANLQTIPCVRIQGQADFAAASSSRRCAWPRRRQGRWWCVRLSPSQLTSQTDNGNFVIDATFDEAHMREPQELLFKLKVRRAALDGPDRADAHRHRRDRPVRRHVQRRIVRLCLPHLTDAAASATSRMARSRSSTATVASSTSPRGQKTSPSRRCHDPRRRRPCEPMHP